MRSKKAEPILTTLVCLAPIPVGAALYSRLPETVATHFGFGGQADGWSSRGFAVFGIPALLAGINLLVQFALHTDPKKENMSGALRAIGVWTAPAVSVFVSAVILSNALGYTSPVELLAPLLTGALFILIGNYLPKTKQSYTVGIRLPWTLASEENWNRTHRAAGFLWVGFGALMVVLALAHRGLGWPFAVLLAVPVLVPVVYSYVLYKKGI